MTVLYRNAGPWGPGVGRNLDSIEVDENFWDHEGRIVTLERATPVTIFSVTQPTADSLLVHMSDGTTFGPISLPSFDLTFRGPWTPTTVYALNDLFTANNSVYVVLLAHTSAGSFDPGANDGMGHDFYGEMLNVTGALPVGGTTDQNLSKIDGTDFNVHWVSNGVPRGGTALQVLAKVASLDWDGIWTDANALGLNLADMNDCAISSPTSGYVLKWDGAAWLPSSLLPGSSTLGGVFSFTSTAHHFVTQVNTDGTMNKAQPAFSDISGTPTRAQVRAGTFTDFGAVSGTISLDLTLGDVFGVTPGGALTIDAASADAGSDITIVVTTSGTTSRTITFGTNFKTAGTLATGTVSGKVFTISFKGDGTNLNETCRTIAM
jgi:hypothetical protein